MSESEYPHWRSALFREDGKAANLWCAVKYVFWHLAYVLLAVVGAIWLALSLVYGKLRGLVGRAPTSSARERTQRVTDSNVTRRISQAATSLALILGLAMSVAYLGYLAIVETVVFIAVVAIIATAFVGAVALEVIIDKYGDTVTSTFGAIGQKSKATPAARRIYGHCPVHFNIEPKWFDNLFNNHD